MALIQMLKTGGSNTFGDLSLMYFKAITAFFEQYKCSRVDIVFDSYRDMSIKAGEREKRGDSVALEVKIYDSATPVPKQWDKYMTNAQNKTSWLNLGVCTDQLLWKRAVSLLLEVAFLITSKL